jgi:hypothetical protein
MIGSRITRYSFSAALALAIPIGGAVAFSSGPAGAVTKTITCKKITGNENSNVTLKKCNGNTGGASKALPVATLEAGGTVTWVNNKTTKFKAPTLGTGVNCPVGDTDVTFAGKVSKDNTGSVSPIPGHYAGEVCVDGSGNLSAPKGHPTTIN